MQPPHSLEAERSVLGRIMAAGPKTAGEVIGTLLAAEHFYAPAHASLYEAIYENYYADLPVDALTIGEKVSKRLAGVWSCSENDAIVRVRDMAIAQTTFQGNPLDHARVVKRHADLRDLLDLTGAVQGEIAKEERDPEEIAAILSERAMRIATSQLLTHELRSFGDLGRRYLDQARALADARARGVELGAYFGMGFLDKYLRGLKPTEMMICAGEPGVGKSAVIWKATMKFAERQMKKDEDKRVGSLILSLEMSEEQSNLRLAQTIAGLDGGRLREGNIDSDDFTNITYEWGRRKELPLYFNFASILRTSQMRALIVEAVRRHNVGLVVIDHFRYFDLDHRLRNPNDEDEEKARFLANSIAKDLNVAVICIAHTTKGIENTPDHRPTLSHLRGSGQVAAHADFVAFVYRPYAYAEDEDKAAGIVSETDAEMIWRKNRHGLDGIEPFYFEPSKMQIS